jgi:hypothetical protein
MGVHDNVRSSDYWLARAEECRILAESFHHAPTRAKMYKIADDYRQMSFEAAARELAEAHGVRDK